MPAGDYFIEVTGVGRGDPFAAAPTGYTDYGSLGHYSLTIDTTGIDNEGPQITKLAAAAGDDIFSPARLDGEETGFVYGSTGLNKIVATFDEQVLLDRNSPAIVSSGGFLDVIDFTQEVVDGRTTVTWHLEQPLPAGTTFVTIGSAFGSRVPVTDLIGNVMSPMTTQIRVLPGDANGDGIVNLADFGTLRSLFGTTDGSGLFADFNNDGRVDLADFGILRGSFGTTI